MDKIYTAILYKRYSEIDKILEKKEEKKGISKKIQKKDREIER